MEYIGLVIPLGIVGIGLLLISEVKWRSSKPTIVLLSDEEFEVMRNSALMRGLYYCKNCRKQYKPDHRKLDTCNICSPDLFPGWTPRPVQEIIDERKHYYGKGVTPAYMMFPDLYKEDEEETL